MHEDNKKLFENNLHKKLKTLSNSSIYMALSLVIYILSFTVVYLT